jgi:hypothetical protein
MLPSESLAKAFCGDNANATTTKIALSNIAESLKITFFN